MVEADSHFKQLSTSILDIYKMAFLNTKIAGERVSAGNSSIYY